MNQIRIVSLPAWSLALLIGVGGVTSCRSDRPPNGTPTAEQATTPGLPLTALRRDFKDSLPIPVGEKLEYEVKLSRFPVYTSLGIVTFEYLGPTGDPRTEPMIKGLNVEFNPPPEDRFLHLRAVVVSKGFLVKLFGADLKYRYETLADLRDFSAHLDLTEIEEGKDHSVQSIIYDRQQQQVKYLFTDLAKSEAPPRAKFLPLQDGMMSLLSAFYFTRLQDYKSGHLLRFPVSTKETNYQFEIVVGGHQTLKTPCGKIKAVKLEPKLFGPGRLLNKKGEMTMWVTENRRHVPLQIVAKSGGATITVRLTNYRDREKSCQIDDPRPEETSTQNREP